MHDATTRMGRQQVRNQTPPARQFDAQMQAFLDWFNRRGERDGLLRAGIAHLRFVTIHPFEDGNGRVARVIADQALVQSADPGQRFYSMSSQIRKDRSDYYDTLERSQKSVLGVTDWLVWFLDCFSRAIACARPTSGNATPVNPSPNDRRQCSTGFSMDSKAS